MSTLLGDACRVLVAICGHVCVALCVSCQWASQDFSKYLSRKLITKGIETSSSPYVLEHKVGYGSLYFDRFKLSALDVYLQVEQTKNEVPKDQDWDVCIKKRDSCN